MHIRHQYPSWSAFVEQASKESQASRKTSRDAGHWSGTNTWSEALALAKTGYLDAVPEVQRLADELADKVLPTTVETFAFEHDVTGDAVDIGRFMAGMPECMEHTIPVTVAKPGRVIAVHANATFSAGVQHEEILKRGAAIVAVVQLLEACQQQTEVFIEFSVSRGYNDWSSLVQIKHAGEPLDIANLMFALAHPAALRRLCFSVMEQEPANVRKEFSFNGGGYGTPSGNKQTERTNPAVQFGEMKYSKSTDYSAEWIAKNMKEWGLIETT